LPGPQTLVPARVSISREGKRTLAARNWRGRNRKVPCATCDADAAFLRSTRPPYEALRPRIRIVDLFAGCGGLTLGVAEAARSLGLGTDVRLAVDTDVDAAAVYKANLPEANFKTVGVEELFDGKLGAVPTALERRLKREVGKVDVLVGGPPCQGHSDLNNYTRRDDPRNALYARMARAIEVLRPRLVLIENVPTVTRDVEKVVDITIEALRRAHYAVADAVVDISRLGAPQTRRRHVVLASRRANIPVNEIVRTVELRCADHPKRTVDWAIRDLETIRSRGEFDSPSASHAKNVRRIAWLFRNRRFDLPNSKRPKCHKSGHSYNSMYGRLRWNKPAQTVTSGFGSMGQGRYVHPSDRRTLTPHEAARLQMLPDFWEFGAVTKRSSLAQLIGNAVPPVLASALLEPALRSLGLEPVQKSTARTAARPIRPKSQGHGRRRSIRRAGVPAASSYGALARMRGAKQRDTAPELALRSELHRKGLRYAIDCRLEGMRGRADIVFPRSRIVIYVDGCFWHGCPQHATTPKANRRWWTKKLADNRRRDAATDDLLRREGWTVLRFWEHSVPSESSAQISNFIELVAARTQAENLSRILGAQS